MFWKIWISQHFLNKHELCTKMQIFSFSWKLNDVTIIGPTRRSSPEAESQVSHRLLQAQVSSTWLSPAPFTLLWKLSRPQSTELATSTKNFKRWYKSYSSGHRPVLLHTVLCLVAQSCLILCDPMDCSPPGSSDHGDSPGRNTGVGCHARLQDLLLLHCSHIIYHQSH